MKKNKKKKNNNLLERLFCIGSIVLTLILLVATIINFIFFPALIIMFSLVLFSICYFYKDDKTKEIFVNILFGIGMSLVIFSTVYTIIKRIM